MSTSRLPAELYHEVVQHIQDINVLFLLLTTSRLLSYEAERVLYRSVMIKMSLDRRCFYNDGMYWTDFSHFERVGHHVRFATFVGVCDDTVQDFLIPILLSLTNMEGLTLRFVPSSKCTPFLYPEKVTFQLLQLTVDGHQGDNGLISFLRYQSRLRKLSWTSNIAPLALSLSDLPSLTTLTTLASDDHTVINAFLLGGNVRLLDYNGGRDNLSHRFGLGTSFPSIRAVILPCLHGLDGIPELFPNLQCLVTSHILRQEDALFDYLNRFEHLNTLRLIIIEIRSLSRKTRRELASKLFICHKNITVVGITRHASGPWFRFERGFEEDQSLVSDEQVVTYEEFTA